MQHSFDIEIASTYSVEVAILLNNIAFWTQKNILNNQHFYENYFWTYNSYDAFVELHPYWSASTIKRTINKAIKDGLLIKGNFNTKRYDRTNWYALTHKGLSLYPVVLNQFNTHTAKLTNQSQQGFEGCESPKPLINTHRTISSDGSDEIVRAIPDSKQHIKEVRTTHISILHSYNIHLPKDEKLISQEIIEEGIKEIEKNGFTLERYLNFITAECKGWVTKPWESKGGSLKRNGYDVILNPKNIRKAFDLKFLDK